LKLAWDSEEAFTRFKNGDDAENARVLRLAARAASLPSGRGDVSTECSGSAINDTGISLFSDKGEVRLTFAEWHELAAMIQPVADHPGLARISFDHLRPAPSSEPEKL
jgi:hypothetical protein